MRFKIADKTILTLAIILIVVNTSNLYILLTTTKPRVSGRAVSGQINLCIGKPSSISLTNPPEWAILSNVTMLEATATNPDGPSYVEYVIFSYGTSAVIDLCQQNYDGDTYYNCSFNTTQVPDGNCNYFIMARCQGPCSQSGTTHYYITINNHDEPPIWDNFKNGITTNFSEFTSWVQIQNPVVGIPGKVILNFTGQTVNFDNANLDSYLIIDWNYLSVNIDALKCLRKPVVVKFENISVDIPKILRNNQKCTSPMCSLREHTSNSVSFSAIFLTGIYNITEGATLKLLLQDTSDFREVYTKEEMTFYANLTNSISRIINFSDVYCEISFNTTGNYSEFERMDFNQTTQLYEFKKTFYTPGEFNWKVRCNATTHFYPIIENTSTFTITNRPPILINNIPNQTWLENTIVTGLDLDDYFMDPDGDKLNYSHSPVPNINIEISSDNVVTFTPQNWWFGNRTVIFYAYDPYGASNNSNTVYLTVIHVPRPEEQQSSTGGGGGGTSTSQSAYLCTPKWECTPFGLCLATGIRVRKCVDVNNCNDENLGKPKEFEYCNYTPTCFDLLKNDGEEGVDCGGPCKPCPSCHNLIQDQGELGVDCGGPCKPCPSCSNGIKDFGEEGVDCGGPCRPCSHLEKPTEIKAGIIPWYYLGVLTIITFSLYVMLKKPRKRKAVLPELINYELKTLQDINTLKNNLIKGIVDTEKLSSLFRETIMKTLNLNFEFTHQELVSELNKASIDDKLKQRILKFSSSIESKKFAKESIEKHEYEKMLNELTKLTLILYHKAIEQEIGIIEEKIKRKKTVKNVNKLLINISSSLNKNDLKGAVSNYKKLRTIYSKLPTELKKKYYKRIISLYERLKKIKE